MKNLHVFLLAAGHGKRAGGPKAWIKHGDKTLLEHHIGFLTEIYRPHNIAVSVQQAWLPRCEDINRTVHWVTVDPDEPALSSVHGLIRRLPMTAWTFLLHVDMPVWEGKLFSDLAAKVSAAEEAGTEAIVPTYEGKGGHPVLLSPALEKPIKGLIPLKDRLDRWLPRRSVEKVALPYECITQNWNTGVPS